MLQPIFEQSDDIAAESDVKSRIWGKPTPRPEGPVHRKPVNTVLARLEPSLE